jgi:hypothetical protein
MPATCLHARTEGAVQTKKVNPSRCHEPTRAERASRSAFTLEVTSPMQVKLSKISVVGAMLVGASSVVACSGVDDYPVSGRGGQQNSTGNGGSSDANGGSNNGNGGATNTNGGSSNGSGGSNSGGMSFGQGGSGQGGSGQGGAAKGGATFGSGGSGTSFGNGGSNNSGGKSGSTGGNGSGGSGTSTGVSFNQVQSIVNKSCGITGCHNSGGESPNLSTTGNTLYGTLTNTAVRQCSSNKLVAANNTSSSALVGLITGKCSLRMPLGCTSSPCIAQADADAISNWITQGAKQQ